jgi:hypothetical protein
MDILLNFLFQGYTASWRVESRFYYLTSVSWCFGYSFSRLFQCSTSFHLVLPQAFISLAIDPMTVVAVATNRFHNDTL